MPKGVAQSFKGADVKMQFMSNIVWFNF